VLLPFVRPVVEAVDLSVMTARPWDLSRDLQHTIQMRYHVQTVELHWCVSLELSWSVPASEKGLQR
jgi:hypothetical protein